MKYIGNKTRLLDFIYESMIDAKIPMKGTFCDIFSGTASVAKFFKNKGFRIISNDFMTYSYVAQYVNVKINKMPTFSKISKNGIGEVINLLNNIKPIKGFTFENYAPEGKYKRQYFSNENAMKIDAIRDKIEAWNINGLLSRDEYYILVYSLINAADFVANISGTYGAYLKIWRSMALKPLKLLIPDITSNNKENTVFQEDSNELIKRIETDVLYIDPPYNGRQYAPNFHVLESLTVWDKPELIGKTGQRNYEDKKSKYCLKREATDAFEDLIIHAKTKYIVLSYNNEGIIPREEIIRILGNKGKLLEYATDYRRFRTESDNEHRQYKKCDDKVIEHLFIVICK